MVEGLPKSIRICSPEPQPLIHDSKLHPAPPVFIARQRRYSVGGGGLPPLSRKQAGRYSGLPAAGFSIRREVPRRDAKLLPGLARLETINTETMELAEMELVLRRAAAAYIPGGNTFLLNHRLHISHLFPSLRKKLQAGLPLVRVQRRHRAVRARYPDKQRPEHGRNASLRRAPPYSVQFQRPLRGQRGETQLADGLPGLPREPGPSCWKTAPILKSMASPPGWCGARHGFGVPDRKRNGLSQTPSYFPTSDWLRSARARPSITDPHGVS